MKAYLALRKHAEEFLTLWHLILTAGLKEVNKASHLEHLTTVSIHSMTCLTCYAHLLVMGMCSNPKNQFNSHDFDWLPDLMGMF